MNTTLSQDPCPNAQRLRERIAELQLANRMLADFAALVSHDLRSGLRRVSSFSDLLSVVPAIEADTHTRAFLKTIQASARRVQMLLEQNRRPELKLKAADQMWQGNGAETTDGSDQHITQLQSANRELAESACDLAQELRTPLAQILSLAEMFASLPAVMSNPVALDMAARVLGGARQIHRLIDDYLRFCNSERQAIRRSRVSIEDLVQLARHELEPLAVGRKVIWHIGPLQEVEGDASMLQQVVLNLLSNALKFTRKRAEAVIEVGARSFPGEVVFHVRDNGIGFETESGTRLFRKFERLHNERIFEGSGVGLVIVQHIIQRHGGRVWAESTREGGATFFFALPVSE